MPRPADGRCADCRRKLPEEHLRDWLTQGTDMCAKHGHAHARNAGKLPAAKAYAISWPKVLDSCLRVMASVKSR